MVSEKKKISRVISFLKKGLSGLADELEGTVKGINEFLASLSKAQKDLTEMPTESEVQTVSTSSKKVVATTGTAKTVAASTLINLLSGAPGEGSQQIPTPAATAAAPSGAPKPPGGGPPKVPSGDGPPKAPAGGGPPTRNGNLPPAPKLPPSAGGGAGPPVAPASSGAFAKRPSTPSAGGPPKAPSGPPGGVATAATPGGGLGSLRDEMLEELTRLKKIMRGE